MRHRLLASAVVLSVAAALVTGCAATAPPAASGGGSPGTLAVAFTADMQVPDPDVFYEVEGNLVMQSVYEGLVRYVPDSAEIEPLLATSWTVSEDGLEYTFTLRDDVVFHDGTPMDASSWVAAFARRGAVGGSPAYMVADVASTAAPDPTTFVVTLERPVSAFLDYLAAPYGPKAVSPTALAEHDGGDLGQTYLSTQDAGTGPYTISSWKPGVGYELTAFEGYWGVAPEMTTVTIDIIPDVATQRLKLESGELDVVLHGLPVQDVETLRKDDRFQVLQFPVLQKTVLSVNANREAFADPAVRDALRAAFDRTELVETVYQGQAVPSTQMYAAGTLPEPLALDVWEHDPERLRAAVADMTDTTIDLAYSEDEGGTLPRLAELLAADLSDLGLDVTVRALPIAQVFEVPALDAADQPDLLLWQFNPDAAHPDTWARIFYVTDGAVNFLNASVPEADAAMDAGLAATDQAEVDAQYGRAGDLVAASGTFLTFADIEDVVVARAGLTGFVHQIAAPYTLRLADLRDES